MNRTPYGNGPKLFPNLGNVNVENTNGSSIYHSLQSQLEHRFSHGVQFTASYTWSHAIDDSIGAFDTAGDRVDFRNLFLERGNSNQDIRHRFVFSSVAELPFGKGRMYGSNMPGAIDAVLGGWQVNPIITLQSGSPFDLNNNGSSRLDLVGDPQIGAHFDPATGQLFWLNPAAFADTQNQHPGNVGRNQFYGPSYKDVDLSLLKNFRPTERVTAQFHADFFNLFNTPQFNNPNTGCSTAGNSLLCSSNTNSNFGKITSTRLASEREVQLGLRFTF
jgi:hypothetical protein